MKNQPLTEPKENHKTEEKSRQQSRLFINMALNVSMWNIIKIFKNLTNC